MASKHGSVLISRQRSIQRNGVANGAVALTMKRVTEALGINRAQLVLNQTPLGLLDNRLAGSPRIGRLLIRVDHLGKPRPHAAIGHAVETRETNKRSLEAITRRTGIGQIRPGAHRLRHHGDANRQLARFLTARHLIGKSVIVIEGHLFDSRDTASVQHRHVIRIPGAYLGKRQEVPHHAPDLLGIAGLGRKTITLAGGSVENARLGTRGKADNGIISEGVVERCRRFFILDVFGERRRKVVPKGGSAIEVGILP